MDKIYRYELRDHDGSLKDVAFYRIELDPKKYITTWPQVCESVAEVIPFLTMVDMIIGDWAIRPSISNVEGWLKFYDDDHLWTRTRAYHRFVI